MSPDRLCLGPHTILWVKMKEEEHSAVLSSFILPTALLVPSRVGQAPSPELEATPASPVMVLSVHFGYYEFSTARRVFCPYRDSLQDFWCLPNRHTWSWYKPGVELPMGYLLRETSSSG